MKYYFLVESGPLGLYTDLYDCTDVKLYSTDRILNPGFLNSFPLLVARCLDKIFRISIQKRLADYMHIPLTEDTCFIIDCGFLRRMDANFLEYLESSRAKICLLLVDSMRGGSPDLVLAKERIFAINWEQVYTIDKDDADEYGWNYIGLNYYSSPKKLIQGLSSDAYFVGGLKGNRDSVIFDLFRKLKKDSYPVFDVYCYSNEQYTKCEKIDGLNHFRKWQSYKKILAKTAATNCIVEILQENQTCQSLRYFEAVVFNKKLLTNNRNVINLPFYDERYMRYFETVGDVDVDWIKKKEQIDYRYNDEFSPKMLFEQIRGDIEKI